MTLTEEARQIVEMLKERRMALGLTRDSVARQIGCNTSSLYNWEAGIHPPNLGNLLLWARALDCKIEVTVR